MNSFYCYLLSQFASACIRYSIVHGSWACSRTTIQSHSWLVVSWSDFVCTLTLSCWRSVQPHYYLNLLNYIIGLQPTQMNKTSVLCTFRPVSYIGKSQSNLSLLTCLCTRYELFVGQPPFYTNSVYALIRHIIKVLL